MSDLEKQTERVNELVGLKLRLIYSEAPIKTDDKTMDYTRPWLLIHDDDVVLNNASYTTVSGFLSALEWIATQRYLYEESK